MHFKYLFILTFISLCVFAQQPRNDSNQDRADSQEEQADKADDASPEQPEQQRVIQFSLFVWPSDSIMLASSELEAIPRLFYDSPTGRQLLSLSRGSNTPLFNYIGPQPLMLYDVDFEEIPLPEDAPPGTLPQTRMIKVPKIKVDVPDEFSRLTLVIMPGKTNPDGTLLTLVLPYNPEVLRDGMSRIYNTTDKNIVLQFEDQDGAVLRANANKHVDFKASEYSDMTYPRVFGYTQGANGKARRVHVSKMRLRANRNNIFLMYAQGRRVRIMDIGSHKEPEPTPIPVPEEEQMDQ